MYLGKFSQTVDYNQSTFNGSTKYFAIHTNEKKTKHNNRNNKKMRE